jgi:hypothetical protein
MAESIPSQILRRATPHASLAALGIAVRRRDLLAPIRDSVQIPQKTVQYSPFDKLYDCFIGILAGIHGVCEINRVLRADRALQDAFGRSACAEQSTIQDTLDACIPQSVQQMEAAMDRLFQTHSQAFRHDYSQAYQILDVDLTGFPCGPKAAFATKGYFEQQKNRRGRQVGRVLATRYDEIVVDRLYPGSARLTEALLPLVEAAAQTLGLTPAQRARTLIRVDAGGGSVGQVNRLLEAGYQVLCKDYSSVRAGLLGKRVTDWMDDPKVRGRQVGWVPGPAAEYVRPVRRIAVRCRKKNGQWAYGVLIVTLEPEEVLGLSGQPASCVAEPRNSALALAALYDQRGGACETSFKGDKQGLGMTRRKKKRFEAQQMLVQLGALAHNVLVWARRWMQPAVAAVRRYGIQRLVRDVFGIAGMVETSGTELGYRIVLNRADRLAHRLLAAFRCLVGTHHTVLISGET